MSGRRNFLKMALGGVAAAPAAARAVEYAADEVLLGDLMRQVDAPDPDYAMRRFAGGVITGESDDPDWTRESARALKLIARLGGSKSAPQELAMSLTPQDRERLAAMDCRRRRLERCKSMSPAARDHYAGRGAG